MSWDLWLVFFFIDLVEKHPIFIIGLKTLENSLDSEFKIIRKVGCFFNFINFEKVENAYYFVIYINRLSIIL